DGVLEFEDFAADVDGDLLGQVTRRDRLGHVGDVADLRGEVGRHRVDGVGQVLPGAGDALRSDVRRAGTLGADVAGHACPLRGERAELIVERIDRVLQFEDFAADVHGDLLRQVAGRHRGRHVGDVADLGGQVGRHRVDGVGQVLPGAGDALHNSVSDAAAARTACTR